MSQFTFRFIHYSFHVQAQSSSGHENRSVLSSLIQKSATFFSVQLISREHHLHWLVSRQCYTMFRRSVSDDCEEEEEQSREILVHYHELQSNITTLIADAHQNHWDPGRLANASLALQSNVNGIGRYQSKRVDTKFYNERRLPDSTMASKVFQIPELLELVLMNLNAFDIVNMASTCHNIRDIVDASSELQVAMFQRAANITNSEGTKFETPFHVCTLAGFEVAVFSHRKIAACFDFKFKD